MSKILTDLNPEQQKAVLQTEGPVLVLAGAGSGKTKTLTHRIAYLICEKKVSPCNILAVTFTNKAAGEMTERVNLLIGKLVNLNNQTNNQLTKYQPTHLPWMGTFHSICVKILRREIKILEYSQNFSIYDEIDSVNLIKKILKNLNLDPKKYNPRTIKSYISSAKCEFISDSEYQKYAEGHFQEIAAKVYTEYEKKLKSANALDFDDLLNKTVMLFEKFPKILEKYQNIFQYILVDEYQDTNTPQYLLVKMLASRHKNICVVGDDWQAIYGFRGANFQNILRFTKDYQNTKTIKLEQNYRSTQNILDAAGAIIKNNLNRTEKNLWTQKKGGDLITHYESIDQHDEVNFIAMEINSLIKSKNLSYKDFVILYRTNAQSRAIEEVMLSSGIPYRIIGGLRFYERKEIKDILAFLRLIVNANDSEARDRIINVPPRGIGAKTIKELIGKPVNEKLNENPKIQKFNKMIEGFREKINKLSALEMIDLITEETGYKAYLLDGSEEGEIRWENVEELKSVARNFEKLEEFLIEVSLVTSIDNYDSLADSITLMTLHNAKGLEFPVVFIIGMEEGLFPHSRSLLEPAEMEEERRLAYVGITRAKERLYLINAQSRLIYGSIQANSPSRFLLEIPEHLVDKI